MYRDESDRGGPGLGERKNRPRKRPSGQEGKPIGRKIYGPRAFIWAVGGKSKCETAGSSPLLEPVWAGLTLRLNRLRPCPHYGLEWACYAPAQRRPFKPWDSLNWLGSAMWYCML
jgi:hypothetical protein